MKKKITYILILIVILISLTGCGQKQEINKTETAKEINSNEEVIGTWTLSRRIYTDKEEYNNLQSLFGTCLNYSSNELTLNEDSTFTFYLACNLNTTGQYKFKNNKLTFNNIKDSEITNEESLKSLEESLNLELIEYNNKKFFKMKLDDLEDSETYIYFENNPTETAGSYADDPIPDTNEYSLYK